MITVNDAIDPKVHPDARRIDGLSDFDWQPHEGERAFIQITGKSLECGLGCNDRCDRCMPRSRAVASKK